MFPALDGAWPLVGHLLEMYRDFPALCARGAAMHGPLFWVKSGPGERQLMCTDPSAFSVLKDPASSNSFYHDNFDALLGNTLLAFDGELHRSVRQVLNPPFTPQRVRRSDLLAIICEVIESRMAGFRSGRPIDIVAEARDMALTIIFRMVGVSVDRVEEWRKQYNRFMFSALPAERVKGPLYWIAKRAQRWLDEQLEAIVLEKRASCESDTLVGAVANARNEHGVFLDRDLVVANLRLLMLAGHETTATGVAWTAVYLASRRALQERAVAEVEGVRDLAAVAMDPERVSFAEGMFREAIRLYPSVHAIVRRATEPIETAAGTVPKNTLVNIPLVHLLRDPKRFPNPDKFDPDRWRKRPRPGSIETAMFGGGPHFCLGYHIAIAEGTLFVLLLSRMLREHNLTLELARPGPLPAPRFVPLVHPPRGIRLKLVRRG